MSIAVYLGFVLSALFGAVAPVLSRQLPPAWSTWLLGVGSVLAAGTCLISLALLTAPLIGSDPGLAARGHWSHAALSRADPVPVGIALSAGGLLAVLTSWCVLTAVRRLRAVRRARELAAALPSVGELVVLDEPGLLACAVPGSPGRIVASRQLLRSLDGSGRRAVLDHERAHLAHRHYLHVALADVARAANPLLWTVPAAVRLSTERWADEVAAAATPRTQVARALLDVATPGRRGFDAVLAVGRSDVTQRIQALRGPAPRLRPWRIVLVLALLCAPAVTTLHAAYDADHLFDHAHAVYQGR